MFLLIFFFFFFFNDTATTEIYTLSLHDALPICADAVRQGRDHHLPQRARELAARDALLVRAVARLRPAARPAARHARSEEHTSELQSRLHLVCRLLLEKKKK